MSLALRSVTRRRRCSSHPGSGPQGGCGREAVGGRGEEGMHLGRGKGTSAPPPGRTPHPGGPRGPQVPRPVHLCGGSHTCPRVGLGAAERMGRILCTEAAKSREVSPALFPREIGPWSIPGFSSSFPVSGPDRRRAAHDVATVNFGNNTKLPLAAHLGSCWTACLETRTT